MNIGYSGSMKRRPTYTRNPKMKWDKTTVGDLEKSHPDLQFVSDSQDVNSIHESIPHSKDYDAFFIGDTSSGDYENVYGITGTIPYKDKTATKLK